MARSSNGPLRRPSSALLCFSALPGVASFEEPIGRTLNIKIYHFPQILKNFLNNRKKSDFGDIFYLFSRLMDFEKPSMLN